MNDIFKNISNKIKYGYESRTDPGREKAGGGKLPPIPKNESALFVKRILKNRKNMPL